MYAKLQKVLDAEYQPCFRALQLQVDATPLATYSSAIITDTACRTFSSRSLGICSTTSHFLANKSITRTCSQITSPCVCVLLSSKTWKRRGLTLLVIGQIIARSRFWLYAVWLITTAGRCPACSLPFVGSKSTQMISPCFTAVHGLSVRPNLPNHIGQAHHHSLQDTSQASFWL